MAVLAEFGIESVGEVMDPDPSLALDDAVRAHEPGEVLLSCLAETRFGLTRKDLVEWARERFEPEVEGHPHPGADRRRLDPLGREPHAGRRDPDRRRARPGQPAEGARRRAPAPLHDHLPALRGRDRGARSSRDLASTLAELYRADIDATGQPMSPDPFHAVQNAIEHYRIDEMLISTFAGESRAGSRRT